jgi:hypothetical protein
MIMDDHNHKALIASVIQQACHDACSLAPEAFSENAREFLQTTNELFCSYCYWLDINPEWAVPFLHARIIEIEHYLLMRVVMDSHKLQMGLLLYPRKLWRDCMRRNANRWRNYYRFMQYVYLRRRFVARTRWPLFGFLTAREVY